MSRGLSFAGMTKSTKPASISSQLWSPQWTCDFGSGLYLLFGELSYHAVARSSVPLGNSSGLASW